MLYGGYRTPGGERLFQCRKRVRLQHRARKFFGGREQGTNLKHLQGGDDPPTSGALKGGFRQGDRESGKAWRVRAGTHHFSFERTRSRRHPLGMQDQGRRTIQEPTGRAEVVTSPRDRLRRHLCPVCRLQSIRSVSTIGGGGYDDSVPGKVTKSSRSGDRTT